MDEREKNRLFQKAGKRSLTPAEQEKLDNWYGNFDISEKDLKVFQNPEHEEKVRIRLFDSIISKIPASRSQPDRKRSLLIPANWIRVAAVFAFAVMSISIYNYVKRNDEQKITDHATLIVSRAQTGKMLKVTLEDGSEIWLNAGSELKYPKHFSAKNRTVFLDGEGFFKVVHNEAKPFIVNTGKLKTTVLGTSFNIRAYPGLDKISVNVATGKVGISNSGKTLCLLSPNQQINFNTLNGAFEVEESNAKLATAWQDGKIRLDGASFKELSLVLKNTWGFTLATTSDRLLEANFKTTFNTNNKIEEVMKTISKMTDAKYRIRDHIITLYE